MPWLSRTFFFIVLAIAVTGVVGGTACTRRGHSTSPPTGSPMTTFVVDPKTGSDTTGTGSTDHPYKTLTKALAVIKKSASGGLTIALDPGNYVAANGETFPIVVPTGVTITGRSYGSGQAKGSFIDGYGEDTAYEKLTGKPAKSAYTTLEIPAGVTLVNASGLYVSAGRLNGLPGTASYAAVDVMGSFSPTDSSFGTGIASRDPRVSGLLVPGGILNCNACSIGGNDRAVGALSVPNQVQAPSIILGGQPGMSTIGGRGGVETDGTVSVTASNQTFQSKAFAFQDSIPAVSPGPTSVPGTVDFGYGGTSTGGNVLIGAATEISVTKSGTIVTAYGDTWNPGQQQANGSGQYSRKRAFGPGAAGQNVTISASASQASVGVGPVPPATPTPSPNPSASPTPTPGPTPT
jgi:hypothetical protein